LYFSTNYLYLPINPYKLTFYFVKRLSIPIFIIQQVLKTVSFAGTFVIIEFVNKMVNIRHKTVNVCKIQSFFFAKLYSIEIVQMSLQRSTGSGWENYGDSYGEILNGSYVTSSHNWSNVPSGLYRVNVSIRPYIGILIMEYAFHTSAQVNH